MKWSLNPYSTGNEVVGRRGKEEKTSKLRLNPYSTGNEVVGRKKSAADEETKCLNPYSTGNEVVGKQKRSLKKAAKEVLILILLEMRLLAETTLRESTDFPLS